MAIYIYIPDAIIFIFSVGRNYNNNYTAPIERLVRPWPTAPPPCPSPSPCLPTPKAYAYALGHLPGPLSYAHAPCTCHNNALTPSLQPVRYAHRATMRPRLGHGPGRRGGPGLGLKRRFMNNIYIYKYLKIFKNI